MLPEIVQPIDTEARVCLRLIRRASYTFTLIILNLIFLVFLSSQRRGETEKRFSLTVMFQNVVSLELRTFTCSAVLLPPSSLIRLQQRAHIN